MLIIRGQILGVRTATFKDKKTGEEKTSHYLQLLTAMPTAGGVGDEVRLPPGYDLGKLTGRNGVGVQLAVRPFVARDKLYLSMVSPQPPGASHFYDLDTGEVLIADNADADGSAAA